MKTESLRAAFLVAVLCGFSGVDVGAEESEAVTLEAQAAFEDCLRWWDGLGLPDLANATYVRVWRASARQGRRIAPRPGDSERRFDMAFCVPYGEEGMALFSRSLYVEPEIEAYAVPGKTIEPAAFDVDLRGILHAAETEWITDSQGPTHALRRNPFVTWHPSRAFFLAVAAAKQGLSEEARRIWRLLLGRRPQRESIRHVVDHVKRDVARARLAVLEVDIAYGRVPWTEAQGRLEAWLARFDGLDPRLQVPSLDAFARVAKEAPGYAAALTDESGSTADRIRRWVHALPMTRRTIYIRGTPWPVPLKDASVTTPTGLVSDPLGRLADAGFDAVPALLGALMDGRPTRSRLVAVYMANRARRPRPRPAQVKDLALAALEQISGTCFRDLLGVPRLTADIQTLEAARAWWAKAQGLGEREWLQTLLKERNADRVAARQLVRRFPDLAFASLRARIEQKPDWGVHWVRQLEPLPGDSVDAFLRSLLHHEQVPLRFVAAEVLGRRGHQDGVDPLLALWPEEIQKQDAHQGPGMTPRTGSAVLPWIRTLLALDAARTVARIEDTWQQTPTELKERVLAPLGDLLRSDEGSPAATRAHAILMGAVLGAEARDAPDAKPVHLGPVETSISDGALEALRPDPAPDGAFDWHHSASLRDIFRRGVVDTWRSRRGLPPMGFPDTPENPDPTLLGAWVEAWELENQEYERVRHEQQLRLLGQRVPEAIEAIAASANALRQKALRSLAARLRVHVDQITWHPEGPVPGRSLRTWVEQLRDAPLDGERLVQLLALHTRRPPPEAPGITLTVRRATDTRGVEFLLRLIPDASPRAQDEPHDHILRVADETFPITAAHIRDPRAGEHEFVKTVCRQAMDALIEGQDSELHVVITRVAEQDD